MGQAACFAENQLTNRSEYLGSQRKSLSRGISFRQTCRLRNHPTPPFPLLADAVKAYFKERTPNQSWLE
jgi:hypothetical protein